MNRPDNIVRLFADTDTHNVRPLSPSEVEYLRAVMAPVRDQYDARRYRDRPRLSESVWLFAGACAALVLIAVSFWVGWAS